MENVIFLKIFEKIWQKGIDISRKPWYYTYIRYMVNITKRTEDVKMNEIIDSTIKVLSKSSSFDEIKRALKSECEKVDFSISGSDWDYMLTEILYSLAE